MAVDLARSAPPSRSACSVWSATTRTAVRPGECARLGIDTTGVRTAGGAVTSFTDAMVERDGGRRTFFHHRGANDLFDASAADLAGYGARILHAGSPGMHRLMDAPTPGGGNGWSALFNRAQAAGMHTNMELVDLPASGWPRWPRPACRT